MTRPAGQVPSNRSFRPEDEEEILALLNAAFGKWPAVEVRVPPIDHLRWKVRSSNLALQYHAIAEVASRIAGIALCIVQRIKLGNQIVLSMQRVDGATHPDFQGTGVMKELLRATRQARLRAFDIDFHVQGTHAAWSRTTPRLEYQRVVRTLHVLLRIEPGAPDVQDNGPWTVREVSQFDEWVARFAEEALVPFQFAVARDRAYLNWRFSDPRAGIYTILTADQDGRTLGYVVLAHSHGRGRIADLLALPGRLDVLDSLLRRALHRFNSYGVTHVDCWSEESHPYWQLLHDLGFVRSRRMMGVVCGIGRASINQIRFLEDPSAVVHITAGDTDLV